MNAYIFHITAYDLAFLGAIFIGLSFALQLAFTKTVNQAANRFLSLALAAMVLWLLGVLGRDIGLDAYFPHWSRLPQQLLLAPGPLIFFYVLKITRQEYRFSRKDLLHFSPLLLALCAYCAETAESIKTGAATYNMPAFQQLSPALQLLAFISVMAYLYCSRKLIGDFYKQQKFTGGDRYLLELRWLNRILTAFGILWLLSIPFIALTLYFYPGTQAYYLFYLLLAVMLIWMAAVAHLKPGVPISSAEHPAMLQIPVDLKEKGAWLKKTVKANLYYQDPELSLNSLADKLGLSARELSRIINTALKKNFTDFINEYRVQDVASKIQDPAYDHITILGIAYESGFNSKATFNRIFKQITGKSPVAYKTLGKKEVLYHDLRRQPRFAAVISNHQTTFVWSEEKLNRNHMFKVFFKVAWRNIWKSKVFSAITILGLTAGFCCCLLIYLFVQHELSYDKFNSHADRIFRVTSVSQSTNGKSNLAVTPAPWAPAMKKDFPEIEDYTRLLKDEKSTLGQTGKQQFNESELLLADSTFFKVFSYSIIKGNRERPLDAPNNIVLTQETATRLFGKEDPIGKSLDVYAFNRTVQAQVTAVVKDNKAPSHFKFNALLSMQTLGDISNIWSFHMFQTYLLLKPGTPKASLENKFDGFVKRYIIGNPNADGKQDIRLQPITDIHLQSNMIGEIEPNGDQLYVYVFAGIGLFILLIACFNYTNLSTARSLTRAKEVGILKVIGAERPQIIRQFIGETFLFAVAAIVLAVLLAMLVLPVFNQLANRQLAFSWSGNISLWLFSLGLLFMVGALAGIYPAFVLSAYRPVEVLKGRFHRSLKGVTFRKVLVTFQFIITIALIASTSIINRQLRFMKTKDVGFDKSNVMIVTLPGDRDSAKIETFKNNLLRDGNVRNVSAASTIPSTTIPVNGMNDGGADLSKAQSMQMLFTDLDFLKTMKMKIVAGRDFSNDFPTDKTEGFIINQAALSKFGWKDAGQAVGHKFQWILPNAVLKSGKIIGVVQDFNITPLKSQVQPLVIHYVTRRLQYLFVRFNQRAFEQVSTDVHREFKALFPKQSIEYTMLDDTMNRMYAGEQKLGRLFTYFSFLAILIACIGILGLSLNSIQQRFKEIGVRKVLGGSVLNISSELIKEFLLPVLVASLIATPIAWILMDKWLQGFAYQTTINIWLFIATATGVLLLSVLTMGYQSVRAALTNPIKSLRTE